MNEQKYTLDEARRLLARRECDRDGHDLSQDVVRVFGGAVARSEIYCVRCLARFEEVK